MKTKDIPYPNMIFEVGERVAKRDAEEFRRQQLVIFKQEQAKKKQAEIKASSETETDCQAMLMSNVK